MTFKEFRKTLKRYSIFDDHELHFDIDDGTNMNNDIGYFRIELFEGNPKVTFVVYKPIQVETFHGTHISDTGGTQHE